MHIKYNDAGLVPAIAQDFVTGRVLMLAWMNEESLRLTLETGYVTYYSRTRERLWQKGESSGHTQRVREVLLDCDGDTILLRVDQEGSACHTGERTCFFNRLDEPVMERREATKHLPAGEYRPAGSDVIADVMDVVRSRKESPKPGSYTNFLFDGGTDKICKKVGEESAEVIIAAKNAAKRELSGEIADLVYHLMVLMTDQGIGWKDVYDELASRR